MGRRSITRRFRELENNLVKELKNVEHALFEQLRKQSTPQTEVTEDKKIYEGLNNNYNKQIIAAWHPATQMQQYGFDEELIIVRGSGSYIYDIEGNKYLDGISSFWVTLHGHHEAKVEGDFINQFVEREHIVEVNLENIPALKLTQRLIKITPEGLNNIFYSDNSTAAIESALKISLMYWQKRKNIKKNKFISFITEYLQDKTDSNFKMNHDFIEPVYSALIFKGFTATAPYCYRCPFGKERDNCQEECVEAVAEIMKRHSEEIAALIIDPIIQNATEKLPAPPGYLAEMRNLCTKYNILLITNEINIGLGRTGTIFASEQESVIPDIMCIGKGLAGGSLPLAATIISDQVYHTLIDNKDFLPLHITTGNPLNCAAALANMILLEEENIWEVLQSKGEFIKNELKKLSQLNHVGEVVQKGHFIRISLILDQETKEQHPIEQQIGYQVFLEAKKRGLIIRPVSDGVVIMPVMSMSEEELSNMIEIIYQAIKEVTKNTEIVQ